MAAKSKKALLERIGTESLASTAYERLRFDIISGVFPPEAKLLIRQLCDRYEMGLSPIREALNGSTNRLADACQSMERIG